VITPAGNVGIGTTDFTTDVAYSQLLKISGTRPALYLADGGEKSFSVYSDNNSLNFRDATAGVVRVVIDTNGNVGIGTTTPGQKLDVSSSVSGQPATSGTTQTNGGFRLQTSASNLALDAGSDGTNSAVWLQSVNKTDLSILTGRLLLNPVGGNVGIGTAAPQSALHVPDGKYAQFEDFNAGAPPAGDCDADAERGRQSIDTTNFRLYICMGATRGWDYVALTN
jgi:hypothetical protein